MQKTRKKPGPYLYPMPTVMVSCTDANGRPNIVTIAWTGVACGNPPMISIAVNPARYSHRIIKESGAFCVNVPTTDMLHAVDYCGSVSGREVDKFAKLGLTPVPCDMIPCHYVGECPINLECRVRHEVVLGSHELFVGEVVAVHADEKAFTPDGRVDVQTVKPIAYMGPEYHAVGGTIGRYGYSVTNEPKR